MHRRSYTKANKPATLICSNSNCDNISSKLYLVEEKLLEALTLWLKNYTINTEIKDNLSYNEEPLLKKSIDSIKKDLERENTKLNKVYTFLESGIYCENEFLSRSQEIKNRIKNLENKLEEYHSLLKKSNDTQTRKDFVIPKFETIMDLYEKLETTEDKNFLLRSIVAKVTYLKTKKATKSGVNSTNFELHIYPKI